MIYCARYHEMWAEVKAERRTPSQAVFTMMIIKRERFETCGKPAGFHDGSSGVAVDTTICRDAPRTKPAIPVQVEGQALEETRAFLHPITAAFEHLELVVQPFDKAARLMVDEVVGNPIQPGVEQREKGIKAV
jgi:hypothetical protein